MRWLRRRACIWKKLWQKSKHSQSSRKKRRIRPLERAVEKPAQKLPYCIILSFGIAIIGIDVYIRTNVIASAAREGDQHCDNMRFQSF